jgi:hypothetical protein
MKPQGSNLNNPGSKYSLGSIIYNEVLFKTGATYLTLSEEKNLQTYKPKTKLKKKCRHNSPTTAFKLLRIPPKNSPASLAYFWGMSQVHTSQSNRMMNNFLTRK